MKLSRGSHGFALPTVVIASLVLMMVLMAALSTTTSTRTALDEQYHTQLAREAAEAGWAKAEACQEQTGTPQWSSAKPLKPETDCAGNVVIANCANNAACFVVMSGNVRTSFSVSQPVTGDYSKLNYTVNATTELVRPGATPVVWKTVTNSVNYSSAYANSPRISGGAGWADSDHIGLVATSDNQLYGFGSNANGQLSNSPSATPVTTPVKMVLPTGVNYVKQITTSGQGTSVICIIGDDDQAYCRGTGFGIGATWGRINVPAGMKVYSMSINGYGDDNGCVIAGMLQSTAQAYCFGWNGFSQFGNNSLASASYTAPARFVLPGSLYAKKVETQAVNICVIASDDSLYCGGRTDFGQIAGNVACFNCTMYGKKYNIPDMGVVPRKAKDVLMQYHGGGEYAVFVLATDGTIWVSGDRRLGMSGTGNTSGTTGTGAPDLYGFNGDPEYYSFGGDLRYSLNSNKCIDVNGGNTADGTKIQLWDCNKTVSQRFAFLKDSQAIFVPMSGKCIDVPGNNGVNGQAVLLHTCNGSPAQQFEIRADGRIMHINSGRCLDNYGGNQENGNVIGLWNCSTNYQFFSISSRARPWQAMIAGTTSFCGLREDSTSGVWCSGENQFGQLANTYSTTYRHGGSCETTPLSFNANFGPSNIKVDLNRYSSEWKYQYFSLQVIAEDGNVYGAGQNRYGKMGSGTNGDSLNYYRECTSVKFQLPPNVQAMDMSTKDEFSTYVLGSDGKVYAAGRNNWGQLGDGTTIDRNVPVSTILPRQGAAY